MVQLLGLAQCREVLCRHEKPLVWLASAGLLAIAGMIFLNRHFIGYNAVIDRHYIGTYPVFWDLSVYLAATQALAMGLDPYNSDVLHRLGALENFHFTSPPVVAWFLKVIAQSHLQLLLKPVLIMLHIGAMIGIPVALGRLLFGKEPERLVLAAAAFLMLFKDAGVVSLGAANNGTILYWWIAAAAVAGFERDRWTSFHVGVLVASMFKPFYIFFWILPVLARGFSFSHFTIAAAGTVVAACSYLLFLVVDSVVFQDWLANLTRQTLGQGDVGNNVFAMVMRLTGPEGDNWFPFAAQLLFDAILAGLLLTTPIQGRTRWAQLILAAVFMNPRVMPYDAAIASVPLAFAGALLLPQTLPLGLRLVLSVSGLSALLLILPSRPFELVPSPILFPLVVVTIFAWTDVVARNRFKLQ